MVEFVVCFDIIQICFCGTENYASGIARQRRAHVDILVQSFTKAITGGTLVFRNDSYARAGEVVEAVDRIARDTY